MFGMIKRELQLNLSNKLLWIGMAIAVLLIFGSLVNQISSVTEWDINGETVEVSNSPAQIVMRIANGGVDMAYPILCALPAALISCEEWNSGFNRLQLTRTNKTRYAIKKLVASGICGGLLLAVPALLLALFSILCGGWSSPYNLLETPLLMGGTEGGYYSAMAKLAGARINNELYPVMQQNMQDFMMDYNHKWEVMSRLPVGVYIWGETKIILSMVLRCFIAGCGWGLLGLAVSAWIPNRYLCLFVPVLISYTGSFYVYQFLSGTAASMFIASYAYNVAAISLSSILMPFILRVCLWTLIYWFGVERRMRNA